MSVIYWIHLHTKSEVRKTPTLASSPVSRLAGSDTKIAGNYIQVTAEIYVRHNQARWCGMIQYSALVNSVIIHLILFSV